MMSKIKDLRKEYEYSPLKENFSFPRFVEKKSEESAFWSWFLNREVNDDISESDRNRFHAFVKLVEKRELVAASFREKDATVNFKISSEDREILYERAKKLGLSVSEYIRRMALNRKITVKTDVEMLMQVRKIGVNINQIARKINMDTSRTNVDTGLRELGNYMEYLRGVLDKIQG